MIGLLKQEPHLKPGSTVRARVEEGVKHLTDLTAGYDATWDEFNDADDDAKDAIMTKQAELQEKIDPLGAWDVKPQVEMAIDALRCPPGEALAAKLAGGERRPAARARLIKSGANLILLDEPTNDLAVNSIQTLDEARENFAGGAVVVSHDRWFLERVATHILAFEGDNAVVFLNGNCSSDLADFRRRKGKDADRPTGSNTGSPGTGEQASEPCAVVQRAPKMAANRPGEPSRESRARAGHFSPRLSRDASPCLAGSFDARGG